MRIAGMPWALMPERLAELVQYGRDLAVRGTQLAVERSDTGAVHVGPVAVIPLYGLIEHRADWIHELLGGSSIESLRRMLHAELADQSVRAVVIDVDSPGGVAYGVPEMAAEIRSLRGGGKPIVAVANSMAASAAYWIASQADEVVVTPSGSVGSIGVYSVHQEVSRFLEELGITTTVISAGEHKTEANEYEPLSDDARGMLQERVDTFYGMFTADVAKGRRTTAAKVEADFGGGRVVMARKAINAGMVDRVETIEATIARLASGPATQRRLGAASLLPDLEATAIRRHHTATDDGAWDGSANEARLPSGDGAESALRKAHAWVDPDADPEAKASYRFIHHQVAEDGAVGAASTTACSTGIGVLNGGRGGTTIPDADREGVWEHLAAHLRDAGQEPPPLQGQASFTQRVVGLAIEAEHVAHAAGHRARSRAAAGRPAFSTSTERALRASRDAIDALLSGEPSDEAVSQPGVPAPSSEAPSPRQATPALRAVSREEFLAHLEEITRP
jgi:signal peptide peptidase SppA